MGAFDRPLLDGISDDDVLHTCLPLFHSNALDACMQALVHGSQFVVGPRFSASRFWDRVVAADATVTYLLGAMASILAKTPPLAAEHQHRLRIALSPATPAHLHELFRERFGVRAQRRLRYDRDQCRHRCPRRQAAARNPMGYVMPGVRGQGRRRKRRRGARRNPRRTRDARRRAIRLRDRLLAHARQTVESWRNLWFHSGDRAVREPDGTFRFLDRMKDAIRRRGENISA